MIKRICDCCGAEIKKDSKTVQSSAITRRKENWKKKYKETICNLEMNLNSVTERLEKLNKANEWHFVKDGKYPKHSNRVLVFTDEGVGFGIYGLDNKKWYTYDTGFDVIAWKEIVLPKESE